MNEEISLSAVVVPLLKGVVYADNAAQAWQGLLSHPGEVADYLGVLGLQVIIDEADGYAYCRQREDLAEGTPRLATRYPLSYRLSLLLAVLREAMLELDSRGEATRLILSRDEIVERVSVYHPAGTKETKLADDVWADVDKVVKMGLARRMPEPQTIEVRRVIKAFVNAEWLAEFAERTSEEVGAADDH